MSTSSTRAWRQPADDGSVAYSREPSIVVVSRLDERYKGHDVLLRALPLVRSRVPTAHLHVIGNGPLRAHLESLAQVLGVAEAVTFHGWASDDLAG